MGFLDSHGFGCSDEIDWCTVVVDFYDTFTIKNIATTVLEDIELGADPDNSYQGHLEAYLAQEPNQRFRRASPSVAPSGGAPSPGPSSRTC